MAHLKATPKTYAQAVEALAGRDSVKLGNNTWLERGIPVVGVSLPSPAIGVRLHGTYIVKFFEDGRVTLHTGGYRKVTTKGRINQFIAGRVFSKNYKWYHRLGESTLEFYEGMDVSTVA